MNTDWMSAAHTVEQELLVWNGARTTLRRIANGDVRLTWVFGHDVCGFMVGVLARLTDDEAQAIWDAPILHAGIMESIRSTMRYPETRLWFSRTIGAVTVPSVSYTIPRESSENLMWDEIFAITSRAVKDVRLRHCRLEWMHVPIEI